MEAVTELGEAEKEHFALLGDQGEDFETTRTFYNIKRGLGMKSGVFLGFLGEFVWVSRILIAHWWCLSRTASEHQELSRFVDFCLSSNVIFLRNSFLFLLEQESNESWTLPCLTQTGESSCFHLKRWLEAQQ